MMDNLLELYAERIQAWKKATVRLSYSAIDPKRNAVALYDKLTQLEAELDDERGLRYKTQNETSKRIYELEAKCAALLEELQAIKDLASGNRGEPMKTRCLAAIFMQANALLTEESDD